MSPPHLTQQLALACLGLLAVADAADTIWFPPGSPTHVRGYVQVRSPQADAATGVPVAAPAVAPAATTKDVPLDKIPVDFLLQLSDVENITYFLNNFVDTDTLTEAAPADTGFELENRFGAGDERKSVQSAKAAICQPQLELVSLKVTTDPSMYYYPTCTRIERCGGCCGSNLLTCQPTDSEIVDVKVIVTQYTGKRQMSYKGNEVIPLERHLKCKCDCIKKETDCNKLQQYEKNRCECVCMNVDDQQKCLAESQIKQWDSSTCTCKCKETRDCNGDGHFDQDSCSCAQTPVLRNRRKPIYSYKPML